MSNDLYQQVLQNNFLQKYNNFMSRLRSFYLRDIKSFSNFHIQMKSIENLCSKEILTYPPIYRYPHTPFVFYKGRPGILPSVSWEFNTVFNKFKNSTCVNLLHIIGMYDTIPNLNGWKSFFRGKQKFYQVKESSLYVTDNPTEGYSLLTEENLSVFYKTTFINLQYEGNRLANKDTSFSSISSTSSRKYLSDIGILIIQAANAHPLYTNAKPSVFLDNTKPLTLYREGYYTNSNNISRVTVNPRASKIIFYTKYKRYVFRGNTETWFDLCAMIPYSNTDIVYRLKATRIDGRLIEVPGSTFLSQEKVGNLFYSKTPAHPYIYKVSDEDYNISLTLETSGKSPKAS